MRAPSTEWPLRLHAVDHGDWVQRIGAYSQLPVLIRQLGADPDGVLSAVGLAPDALDNPENIIPYAALGALLRESAERTGCAHVGLLAGRMWRLADLGLLGEVVVKCRDVGEALEMLAVYQHLNSQGALAFLLERAGVVDFGYAIYHPDVIGTDQIYDATLAAAFSFMHELCGDEWGSPSEVFLPHAQPAGVAHYRNLFKTRVRFDADTCALRFPSSWMRSPLAGFDAQRARAGRARAETIAHEQEQPLQDVYRVLRRMMLNGNTSGDTVAQMLSMHRRTLNRRLKREGTTFQQVLDEVRFAVARELLGSSRVALDDIAATLGYAGVSPFMRAFQRWTGHTAGQWRRGILSGKLREVPYRPRGCHPVAAAIA